MTTAEFETAVREATTADELRTAVDLFVPTFTQLKLDEKNRMRALWKRRLAALGVTV